MILAKVQYKNDSLNASDEKVEPAMAIMNLVAVAQFFETTCTDIFIYFLTAWSTKSGLFGPVLIHFRIGKRNS